MEFKEKCLHAHAHLNLTQIEFAKKLKFSYFVISRWKKSNL